MAELSIETRSDFGLAAIMARKGVDPAAIGTALGRAMPAGPHWTGDDELAVIGNGPGTWLAVCDDTDPAWCDDLAQRLRGLASVSDQSSGYAILRLSGPGAQHLLQRGAAIDLDPAVFAAGHVAVTLISHIGVIIRQIDDRPTYDVATFRSYAQDFRHWVDTTAAAL